MVDVAEVMRNIIRTIVFPLLLTIVAAAQSGCLLVAAGGAGAAYLYTQADTEAMISGEPPEVARAAEAAAKQMDLVVISTTIGAFESEVIARSASDKRVRITIKRASEKTSNVWLRAGGWGDDTTQQLLLGCIRQNLTGVATTKPAAAPVAVSPAAPSTRPAATGTVSSDPLENFTNNVSDLFH